MSTGLVTLVGNGSGSIVVTRPGPHTVTIPVTVSAPPSLDHLDYTLSSSTATVGGAAPTGTVTKWQDAGETTPFTGSVSLGYTSSNTAVATINSSTGVITIVAAGSCTFTVTDSVSTKTATTGTLTVSAAGSYAYTSTTPLATALVSDWPGKDYASLSAFQSNTLSRYRSAPTSAALSFDSTNQWGGYPTLASDLSTRNFAALKIPSASSQTDIVYHVRHRMRGAEWNDPVLPISQSRGLLTGQWSCLMGLQFDPTIYISDGITAYHKGIALDICMNAGSTTGPQYRLSAAVMNSSGTVLSDATSNTGDQTTATGDEWYDNAWYDFFLRVQKVGTSLVISAYYNAQGSAPKQIGNSITLTMLDSSTPPMPTDAVLQPDLHRQANASLLAPATLGHLTAFHQVLDNATHPNTALDFTGATAWGTYGVGHKAIGWGERAWDWARYASDSDFKADADKRYYLQTPTQLTWKAADTTHGNKPFIRYAYPVGGGTTGVWDQPANHTRPVTTDLWLQEHVIFAPNFTTNADNTGSSTGYKFYQVANASNTNVQRFELTATSVGNAGTGLSGHELYAYTPSNDVSVFDQTLSATVTQAMQTGYAISFSGAQVTVTTNFAGMPELDFVCPLGDGTDNRDGLERVFTLHAHTYFDGTLGASGRWVRKWELFIGYATDSAPYCYTGWAAVYNDGQVAGTLQYMNNVDWGENRNQGVLYDTYIDRWGQIARSAEEYGSDPFGVVAARAAALPKAAYSVVNKTNSGGTVVNTVKLFPLTTQIIPVIDGVDQSAVNVTCPDGKLTSVDVTHASQASGTHTYNYKTKNANGTTSPTVSNLSVTVP